jgi:uncharacterized membrane protein
MEEIAKTITIYISHGLEIISAIVVGSAVFKLLFRYIIFQISKDITQKTPLRGGLEGLRVQFGRAVAVALELLLGADVLATAVAPTWDEIGKLAAIATIRTALNFFLEKELSSGLHSEKHSKSPA